MARKVMIALAYWSFVVAFIGGLFLVRWIFGRETAWWVSAVGISATLLYTFWQHYLLWKDGKPAGRVVLLELLLAVLLLETVGKLLS